MAEPAPRPCSIEGCPRPRRTRAWCSTHYERWRIHGDPLHETYDRLTTCTIAECQRPYKAARLCAMHYSRVQRGGAVGASQPRVQRYSSDAECEIDGCAGVPIKRGWCSMHYARWKKSGDPVQTSYEWGVLGQPCDQGRRRYCSGACKVIASRLKHGRITVTCRTCGTDLPKITAAGGSWKRGNGHGLCLPCARVAPCGTCGSQRVMSAGRLVCRPCRRPGAIVDQMRRRARRLAAICEHGEGCVDRKVIADVRAGECLYCGAAGEHADHFEPLARGGKHCRLNLVAACAKCNLSKSDNDPWEWWSLAQ